MKKFKIDLSEYEIEIQQNVRNPETKKIELKDIKEIYPLKNNLSSWLRISGVWKDGIELCDAHDLAKQIKDCQEDAIEVDETEMKLLKKVLNKLITQEEDPQRGVVALGGVIHEEAVRRVFKAVEI